MDYPCGGDPQRAGNVGWKQDSRVWSQGSGPACLKQEGFEGGDEICEREKSEERTHRLRWDSRLHVPEWDKKAELLCPAEMGRLARSEEELALWNRRSVPWVPTAPGQ